MLHKAGDLSSMFSVTTFLLHHIHLLLHTGWGNTSCLVGHWEQRGEKGRFGVITLKLTLGPPLVLLLSLRHYLFMIFPWPPLLKELLVWTLNNLSLPRVATFNSYNRKRTYRELQVDDLHSRWSLPYLYGVQSAPPAPVTRVKNYSLSGDFLLESWSLHMRSPKFPRSNSNLFFNGVLSMCLLGAEELQFCEAQ